MSDKNVWGEGMGLSFSNHDPDSGVKTFLNQIVQQD